MAVYRRGVARELTAAMANLRDGLACRITLKSTTEVSGFNRTKVSYIPE